MRGASILALAVAASLAATPALAWRGGGGFGGGGFDRGGFGGGGFDRGGGGFGGADHDMSTGWHEAPGGADFYHGAGGGDYRPPQMTATGYKPPAGYAPGNAYHGPTAAVGADAYHPAGAVGDANAYHGPVAVSGYPDAYHGYPPVYGGYPGYGYAPYAGVAAAAIVTGAVVGGAVAASEVPATTIVTVNCGGPDQPVCGSSVAPPISPIAANNEAAGNAVLAAALNN